MARETREEKESTEAQVEPKKKTNVKWIIIGTVLLALITAVTIAGFLFFKGSATTAKPAAEVPAVVAVWPMDAFIINIADTNGERYLKMVIQLEVSDQSIIPELEQLKPRLRDSILDLLTPKTYKDLMDVSGKQRLREDIAGRVNNTLSKGKVTKVYITDFVVQ